ncbi:MAG: hypothetical protein M1483_08400 [Actinobacteria bacterium]|nr:hypothetical protein [Actinomycetota bacterium]
MFWLTLGIWLLAGISAVLTKGSSLRLSGMLSALGGILTVVGGIAVAIHGRSVTIVATAMARSHSVAIGTFTFSATPLSSLFLVLLGVVATAVALYAPKYHRFPLPVGRDSENSRGWRAGEGFSVGTYTLFYNLTLMAALAVLLAGDVVTFLVFWETTSLCAWLLVAKQHDQKPVRKAALMFLIFAEVGFGFIITAFVLLATRVGTLSLSGIATLAHTLSTPEKSLIFVLAVVGFGIKAGMVPMHIWSPGAYSFAPSDGSAFIAGFVTNLGIYGIALFSFYLFAYGPAWWGILVMVGGAISAVLGVLYALAEKDSKRFLAYSSIENIGIILVAIGAGLIFRSYGILPLATFLLLAALYHMLNHGVYKTLLFLEAGVVERTARTRDMDRLGGLIHRMGTTTVITLIGTLSIAALPPLNGFVSEWLIFQGLFQGFRIPEHAAGVLVVAGGACLALTGGLAISAFTRSFGISFLGIPRSRGAQAADETSSPISGPLFLAILCIGLAVGAPAVLVVLSRITGWVTRINIEPKLVVGNLTVIPAHTNFSAFSPTYLAVFLVAVSIVPITIYFLSRPRAKSSRAPVWDGGILSYKPRMQNTATTYANPTRVTFRRLYQPDVHLQRASDDPAGRSGPVQYRFQITPLFELYVYAPIIRIFNRLGEVVKPIQSGNVNLYLAYVFIAFLVAVLVR